MNSEAQFRSERFIDQDADDMSLVLKIGEYTKTPLYKPSVRSMCLTLSDVRKQLEADRKSNQKFNQAWKAASKLYETRSAFLREKFEGPEEYCIAIISLSLDSPFKIYDDFNRQCQQLLTDTWSDFSYKSLLYLLIQSELRMISIIGEKSEGAGPPTRHPITITTDLDYSIEEVEVEEDQDDVSQTQSTETVPSPRTTVIHGLNRLKMFRVYRGMNFVIGDLDLRPRNLVAFNHVLSTTMNGTKLANILEEKGRSRKGRVTLLEIDQVSWSARSIVSISAFPVENEVIIWPWIKFFVEERKMISEHVEKIVLKPTSCSFMHDS